MENSRNFLIAMALSIAVLVGWQFLVINPRMEAERLAAQNAPATLQTPTTPAGTEQEGVVSPAGRESVVPTTQTPAVTGQTREAALAASPRIAIDTPSLSGSINLIEPSTEPLKPPCRCRRILLEFAVRATFIFV